MVFYGPRQPVRKKITMSGAKKAVGSKGVSPSWNGQQSNVLRILNEFKNQDDALKKLFVWAATYLLTCILDCM